MELPIELIEKIKGKGEKENPLPKDTTTEQHKNNIDNSFHYRLDPFIQNEDYSEPITPENDKVDRSNELWEKNQKEKSQGKSQKEKRRKFNATFNKLWKARTGKYISEVPMLPEEDALYTMNTKLEQGNQDEQKKTGLSEKEVHDLISGFIKDLEKNASGTSATSSEEQEEALQAIKNIVNEFQIPVVIQEKETPREEESENKKIEPEIFNQKVEEYALDFSKSKALYGALRIENGNFKDFAYGIFTQILKRELNDFGIPTEQVFVDSTENKDEVKVIFKNEYSLRLDKKYFPSKGMTEKESRAQLEKLMNLLLTSVAGEEGALRTLEDQNNFILANENRKIKDRKIKTKNTPEKRTPKRGESDPVIALRKKLSTDEFILLNKKAKTPSYGKDAYTFLLDQAKKREKGEEYFRELDSIIDKISPQQ